MKSENENEHYWARFSLTFGGYGGVCCKAENRNKKKRIKRKIKSKRKKKDIRKRKAIVSEKRPYTNIHDVENIKLFLEYSILDTTLHWKSYEYIVK